MVVYLGILISIYNVCIRVAFQSRFHARHVASDIGYSYILCAKNNGNSCPLACKINGTSSSGFLARLTWSNLLWGESPSQEVYIFLWQQFFTKKIFLKYSILQLYLVDFKTGLFWNILPNTLFHLWNPSFKCKGVPYRVL